MDIKKLTSQAALRAFRPDTRRGPQGAIKPTPSPTEPEVLQIEAGASLDLLEGGEAKD